ncbi:glycosyltransferase [Paenibacillus sp. SYP-B4298]|uniref:glycosyltransferase n=1 Tax=Paenibacillus sp. SYP-B4298 TaxID=2996034 RepID=UPI0022DDEA20|nr:glycosyltransferase [Paenibacillus sp. SYP-B4298]
MSFISAELAARFQHFGENTFVQQGGEFVYPPEIAIGSHVFIRAHYWFNIVTPGTGRGPKIMIGDGCQCNLGLIISAVNRVELKANVLIGPNVYISDTDHHYQSVGIPVHSQGITSHSQSVEIGEGAWIGANAVIVGDVRIGRGSVISANSVVTRSVPEYCVVGGSPASILEVYDTHSGKWVRTHSERQALLLLEKRKDQPLMSICIPTYNRAGDLSRCLASIYDQIGDTELIEVVVSDNASTDGTSEILKHFAARYSNFRYVRNEVNVGADANIMSVVAKGRGTFLKIQGDDDFFLPGTVLPLLNVLYQHRECAVIHIDLIHPSGEVVVGNGMDDYLARTSIYSSFISSTILRRKEWEQIEEKSLFLSSSFNQIYWQYAILEQHPQFCIVHRSIFSYAGNDNANYDFGEVFIDGYQRILQHFVGKGLAPESVREDKRKAFYNLLLPRYSRYAAIGSPILGRFEEYFTLHYQDEAYYEEAMMQLRAARQHGGQ